MTFHKLAAAHLWSFTHNTIGETSGMLRAAVGLLVLERSPTPGLILIRRAFRGRNAGQWGLPGGRLEDGETLAEALLRELYEEIGILVQPEDIVGRLDDFPAASGISITPFVVAIDRPGPLRPSPTEVHSVHMVDLASLACATAHWASQPDGAPVFQLRLLPNLIIHAPTGAILWQFREVVLHGRHTRVADYGQPDWTYR